MAWESRLEVEQLLEDWDPREVATTDAAALHQFITDWYPYCMSNAVDVDEAINEVTKGLYYKSYNKMVGYQDEIGENPEKDEDQLLAVGRFKLEKDKVNQCRSRFKYAMSSLNKWYQSEFDLVVIRMRPIRGEPEKMVIPLCEESIEYYIRKLECKRSATMRDLSRAKRIKKRICK